MYLSSNCYSDLFVNKADSLLKNIVAAIDLFQYCISAENVHGLCQELDVHVADQSAHDQLHAALPGGDADNRHGDDV